MEELVQDSKKTKEEKTPLRPNIFDGLKVLGTEKYIKEIRKNLLQNQKTLPPTS